MKPFDRDGVILPNLPTTKPDDATNTFPDANQNEPFNTSEAPAELNISVKGAQPEAFDFDAPGGSITAPNLNGTLQLKDRMTEPELSGSDGSLGPQVLSEAVALVSDKMDPDSATIDDLDQRFPDDNDRGIPKSVSFDPSQDSLEALRDKDGRDPISDSGYGEGALDNGGQPEGSRPQLGFT